MWCGVQRPPTLPHQCTALLNGTFLVGGSPVWDNGSDISRSTPHMLHFPLLMAGTWIYCQDQLPVTRHRASASGIQVSTTSTTKMSRRKLLGLWGTELHGPCGMVVHPVGAQWYCSYHLVSVARVTQSLFHPLPPHPNHYHHPWGH